MRHGMHSKPSPLDSIDISHSGHVGGKTKSSPLANHMEASRPATDD